MSRPIVYLLAAPSRRRPTNHLDEGGGLRKLRWRYRARAELLTVVKIPNDCCICAKFEVVHIIFCSPPVNTRGGVRDRCHLQVHSDNVRNRVILTLSNPNQRPPPSSPDSRFPYFIPHVFLLANLRRLPKVSGADRRQAFYSTTIGLPVVCIPTQSTDRHGKHTLTER